MSGSGCLMEPDSSGFRDYGAEKRDIPTCQMFSYMLGKTKIGHTIETEGKGN